MSTRRSTRSRADETKNVVKGFDIEGLDDLDTQAKVQKLSRSLHFDNPGRKLAGFEEEIGTGSRQKRAAAANAAKKLVKEEHAEHWSAFVHNVNGRLISDDREFMLCDCLNPKCTEGCFWPCAECGSRRCSSVCQRLRSFAIASTAQSGGGVGDKTKTMNPCIPPSCFDSQKNFIM
ncbi:hypothetical protein PMAYCL1PPCAC_14092 [Pristionchus mayeri]|uniref:ARF7 effector protein C-terminal domain-containing protein n=1 Tax=Pristionchus mayeri TaxID=1317129 RepID=A0AAN4ZM81_9BILA|nr:hypothetical protein PMAYCL1PPCAC_14092 [Pristionchus mayeri]